jgi:hypothetical protein
LSIMFRGISSTAMASFQRFTWPVKAGILCHRLSISLRRMFAARFSQGYRI